MGWLLSPRARADLDEIWDYTVQRWGIEQAETYIRRIERTLALLAENPTLGRAADDVRPGYRKHACGAHMIYYRQIGADVAVIRILHQRMDVHSRLDRNPSS